MEDVEILVYFKTDHVLSVYRSSSAPASRYSHPDIRCTFHLFEKLYFNMQSHTVKYPLFWI